MSEAMRDENRRRALRWYYDNKERARASQSRYRAGQLMRSAA